MARWPGGDGANGGRLHAVLRLTDLKAPHFTERVAGAQTEVGDRERTPALPGPDRELRAPRPIHQCRILMWALFTTCRWRHDDQLPDGHHWSMEGLNQVRAALDRYGPDWA